MEEKPKSCTYWGTNSERGFIRQALDKRESLSAKLKFLECYLKTIPRRWDWGLIDRKVIVNYCNRVHTALRSEMETR